MTLVILDSMHLCELSPARTARTSHAKGNAHNMYNVNQSTNIRDILSIFVLSFSILQFFILAKYSPKTGNQIPK